MNKIGWCGDTGAGDTGPYDPPDVEEDGDGYCECGAFHDEEECGSNVCSCCGLRIDPNDVQYG